MRRRVLRGVGVLLAALAAFALVACGMRASQRDGGESDGPRSTVRVELSGNAGTGYEWTYSSDAEDVLALTAHDTSGDSDGAVDGAPTVDAFEFEAQGAGTVHLSFSYERPWEPGQPTFSCTLDVSDGLDVEMTEFSGADEYRGCIKVS